ncbi:hypothetical protein FUT87_15025 [Mitsuaria sp. TWR114]|jgi:hypothetical protein|uniref:hypothetical protein n=1 Tax=unclassified Roseateles TaxID=2626991 RepID=UPI0011BF0B4C|nr:MULTISPECIES: hypothetical protein [unclassified Roseateles]MBB3292806.1 hypothetical protein [Mitsuaria sp. BK041]MBB3362023.1 hypothetical protein [Mitsuaria sp. BK045]TXD85823.1 hypothetical protein FUT87_15025 [Mitsuaria sp. TWR114]
MSITKHAKAARTEPTSLFKTALLLCSLAMTIGLLFSAVQDARGAGLEDDGDAGSTPASFTVGDDG